MSETDLQRERERPDSPQLHAENRPSTSRAGPFRHLHAIRQKSDHAGAEPAFRGPVLMQASSIREATRIHEVPRSRAEHEQVTS